MWLRTGQLANRVQDIALAYRCAVIMPEGGSIWELYHGCYLGYKPNQDIIIDKPWLSGIYVSCTIPSLRAKPEGKGGIMYPGQPWFTYVYICLISCQWLVNFIHCLITVCLCFHLKTDLMLVLARIMANKTRSIKTKVLHIMRLGWTDQGGTPRDDANFNFVKLFLGVWLRTR